MDFVRKHKWPIIFGILLLLLVVVIILVVLALLPKDPNEKYGNRIEGIENVRITDSRVDNVKGKILNDEKANKITYKLDGRLIKFFIEVKKDTDELSVESMLNVIVDNFIDEEKAYYDFQIYITCEEKQELYPMIAYKHRNNEIFTITKKEGSKDEE